MPAKTAQVVEAEIMRDAMTIVESVICVQELTTLIMHHLLIQGRGDMAMGLVQTLGGLAT